MTPVVARGIGYEAGRRTILDRIDLDLEAGSLDVLVGPNGAGKSTLMRVLAGDAATTRGEVLVRGRPIADYKPLELALIRAVLPQRTRIEFAFSVRQVVEFGRYARSQRKSTSGRDDSEEVEKALSDTETTALADVSFPALSVGEQALVMIARTLAQETPVLLLDEPTAYLDIRHQHRVMGLLRERARRGVAVMAILHDLNLATGYADRIGILAGGRMRALGPPDEVLRPALLSDVYRYPIQVLDHPSGSGRLVATSDCGTGRSGRSGETPPGPVPIGLET